jgi:hypothetical protein
MESTPMLNGLCQSVSLSLLASLAAVVFPDTRSLVEERAPVLSSPRLL